MSDLQAALDAQSNFNQFTKYMADHKMKVAIFQIGPYQIAESTQLVVAMSAELLEDKGYKVDVSVNVLSAERNPNGPGILFGALAVLVVRAPRVHL